MRQRVTLERAFTVGNMDGTEGPRVWAGDRKVDVCICGTFLNSYNPGPLCHRCEKEAGPASVPLAQRGRNGHTGRTPDTDFLAALAEGPLVAKALAKKMRMNSTSHVRERMLVLIDQGEVAREKDGSTYVYRLVKDEGK